MIIILTALLFGGMPSGLAAYLQAETKGWRYLIGFALTLLAATGLVLWAAASSGGWTAETEGDLVSDPRVLAGRVIFGVMFWAVLGAIVGKVFERKVEPISLGLRTAVGASLLKFALSISLGTG